MLRTPRFIYASASESLPGGGFPKTYHQPPGKVRAFPDPFHRPIKLLNSPDLARSGTRAPWCLTSLVVLGLPVGEAPSARSGNTGGSRPHPRGRPSTSLLRVRGCWEAGGAAAPDRDLGKEPLGARLRDAGALQGPRRIRGRQTRRRWSRPGQVSPHHLLLSLRRGSKPLSCKAPVVQSSVRRLRR